MIFEPESTGTATYCPEDDKIRLYVGRVPRPEYDALRAEGWKATPKQDCDFVATWTTQREDTALCYSPEGIDDEDQSPQERAADRAERFAGYREKRFEEATGHADAYEAGPQLHGYQSQALAERRANRHDKIATRAVNQWEKAEYWQRRTAGVIGNALYKSGPGVRMGRIKILEAEQRKIEKDCTEAREKAQGIWDIWNSIAGNQKLIVLRSVFYVFQGNDMHPEGPENDEGKKTWTKDQIRLGMAALAVELKSYRYGSDEDKEQDRLKAAILSGETTPEQAAAAFLAEHPTRPEDWQPGGRWYDHITLRLAYENQMLEAQGGRAAFVEMEPGGWLGIRQIQKVNKSPATGRVVSVQVWGESTGYTKESGYTKRETRPCLLTIKTERMKAEVYRAPTDEERAAFLHQRKAAKKKRGTIPTINPTRAEAERLQAQINKAEIEATKGNNYPHKGAEVEEMTQARFSGMCKDYREVQQYRGVKIRVCSHGWQRAVSVVVLTDKPQKAFPASVWDAAPEAKEPEKGVSVTVEAEEEAAPVYKDNPATMQREMVFA